MEVYEEAAGEVAEVIEFANIVPVAVTHKHFEYSGEEPGIRFFGEVDQGEDVRTVPVILTVAVLLPA
jgi:hypothetical protein